jgi:hypothetical protein
VARGHSGLTTPLWCSLVVGGEVSPLAKRDVVSEADYSACPRTGATWSTGPRAWGSSSGANEMLTPHETIRAYTWGSAYASLSESVLGSLSSGEMPDFVVLRMVRAASIPKAGRESPF